MGLQNFFSLQIWNSAPIKQLPYSPLLPSQVTPILLSASMNLTILGTLYKRDYTVFVFLWQAYFT